jgi:hypothetical protein
MQNKPLHIYVPNEDTEYVAQITPSVGLKMVLKIASVDSYGLLLTVVSFFMLDSNVAIGALVLVFEECGIYSETSPAAFDRD